MEEVSVLKLRIKFAKRGYMKFVGHLDTMRYFQKAIRRADIDIAYSEGFNPHQLMSFAAPLGVGMTSEGEYMDIVVKSATSSEDIKKSLNETMVEGMEIISVVKLPDDSKNAMSIVAAADYSIKYREGYETDIDIKSKFDEFLSQESIIITKKTKKSEKEVDIRPSIYEAKYADGTFELKLASASGEYLKPDLVFQAFNNYCGITDGKCTELKLALLINRVEVYAKNDNGFIPLEGLGGSF